MAAVAFSTVSAVAAKPVVARKAFSGAPVAKVSSSRVVCRVSRKTVASSDKHTQIAAGVTTAVGAMLANPLYAEAAVTPSLKNLLNSVVAGGVVLGLIFGAVTAVSSFDPLDRK